MLFKNNNLDNFEVSMVTEIEVNESLVKMPLLQSRMNELFHKAKPSKEERDEIVVIAVEMQRHMATIAAWALGS
jgi:hypothetical protein